ncbi:MAG TPA: alpha-1,4-glucan--maltose-1-phosphate maltosyltransferase, partial [Acidimicrobiales bacterium]|nr:alpha-1,4-glucan--maltose-1-phosphate maltosyltransferase [Acidimicrobiales bacterium]
MSTPEAPRRPAPVPARSSDVVVEKLEPRVDCGQFPAKAVVGSAVGVTADVFTHGHDLVRACLRWRRSGTRTWKWTTMSALGNDRFSGSFVAETVGVYDVEVVGNLDRIATWRRDAARRLDGGRFDSNDPLLGAQLLEEAADELGELASGAARGAIARLVSDLESSLDAQSLAGAIAGLAELDDLLAARPPRAETGSAGRVPIFVQRERAGFSAWYECFPRSASPSLERPGTLLDLANRLDYVTDLGFDVLYLPPVHPIGTTARKGRNNSPVAEPGDVGSPWAIGSALGGHEAIAPELGTIADFETLAARAAERGVELALDLVFTCSPDHPWVSEHPGWFRHRADGTIACAENPPKLYQDTYPFDFDNEDREGLWQALLAVTLLWVERGVRIFRVDNPHTKPFAFFEWMIAEVRRDHPEVIFLAEAFTRPKVMHRLAKLGFDQSYTYFAWRDAKWELTEYFEELAHGSGASYFRPNVWPNTPDILAKSLQHGGRAAFVARFVLAAGLSASYGIYGPPFELLVDAPATAGSEEYLDSEKYEVRHWDLDDPSSIRDVITRVNRARRAHPAMQDNASLRFHQVDNDQLICWSKHAPSGDAVLCVVNLDPYNTQSGYVHLDLGAIGLGWEEPFVV